MHSILWASILASAGVAVVTTLLVEYLAKPELEARKERILEDKRERRNALKDFRQYAGLAGQISGLAEDPSYDQPISMLRDSVQKMTGEMEALLANVQRVIEAPTWFGREWNKVIPIITGLCTTFYAEGRLSKAELDEFDEALRSLVDFSLFSQHGIGIHPANVSW